MNESFEKIDRDCDSKFKYQNLVFQAGGKDCKAELRDHDHVVECVAWAPEAATQVILEQGGHQEHFKSWRLHADCRWDFQRMNSLSKT